MSLHKIYTKYRDDVEFMLVYIREAHPTDKWWLGTTKVMRLISRIANKRVSFDTPEPITIEERREVALEASALLGDMPVYVDEMDNKVDKAYTGWPTRVYLIGKDGRVYYESGKGPWGLNPEEFDKQIGEYLALQTK